MNAIDKWEITLIADTGYPVTLICEGCKEPIGFYRPDPRDALTYSGGFIEIVHICGTTSRFTLPIPPRGIST
mgnify:FL=1